MGPLLALLFFAVPIAELYVLVQVGQEIGILEVIFLVIAISIAGAYLVKRQGMRAWHNFTSAMAAGRVPAKEAADGLMIMFAGALLLTPGFLTDVLALALLLPPVRAVLRRTALLGFVRRIPVVRVAGPVVSRVQRPARPPAAGGPLRDSRGTQEVRDAQPPD